MTIPTWLQRHLEDRGLWDLDSIGRAARARRCRTCRDYVLAGLDADRCALPVAADPDPLSVRGEAIAILAGKPTYSLRYLSNRFELDHRGHFDIRGDPRRLDVLAGHICGQPSLGTLPELGQASRLAPPAVPIHTAPPF